MRFEGFSAEAFALLHSWLRDGRLKGELDEGEMEALLEVAKHFGVHSLWSRLEPMMEREEEREEEQGRLDKCRAELADCRDPGISLSKVLGDEGKVGDEHPVPVMVERMARLGIHPSDGAGIDHHDGRGSRLIEVVDLLEKPVHVVVAAADLAALGANVMSCTPSEFPDVLAGALA